MYLLEQLARMALLPLYLILCEYTFGIFACCSYVAGSLLLAGAGALLMKKIPVLRKIV